MCDLHSVSILYNNNLYDLPNASLLRLGQGTALLVDGLVICNWHDLSISGHVCGEVVFRECVVHSTIFVSAIA